MYMQMDNSKTITLGLVYADWCGHCNAFKPEWNVAKDMLNGSNSNIKIVEINEKEANKDEVMKNIDPTLVAEGYPTIFKKVVGEPVEYYTGERNSKDLVKWVLPQKTQNGGCNCGTLWKTKKSSRKRRNKSRRSSRRRRNGGSRTFNKRKN